MNTNILKITAIMLLLAVTIIGCDNKNIETHQGVDSEINIRMVERFDKYPRTLQMDFWTTKIYPCFNFPIILSWQKSSNVIDITFKEVIDPGICLTALGPARAVIDLGVLSNGTYQLNFQNGKIKHSGELIVSSDSYTISFPANSAFNFTNSPLNKIPEHTIWGLVGYHTEKTLPLVQKFFTALMELGATEKSFTPGYYTAFEIDDNGDIAYWSSHGHWFAQPFIFYYAGDSSDLDEFLRQWTYKYREYMSIRIFTDSGEQFLSWMY
jgi:hypothetical protein